MTLASVVLALSLSVPRPTSPAAPPPAGAERAASPADVRDQVRAYLGAIHGPVAPEAFRALGPGAEDALAEFARTDESPIRRVRALEALAGLGGARATTVHREVATSSSAPRSVRRAAVRGLGRLAGPTGATRVLTPFLEQDRDPAVRAAAAEALAAQSPADGCARVRARARAEPDASRFRRALTTCERAGATGAPRR